MIGTGAAGIQMIAEIADKVGELTIFQRRPNWSAPLHNSLISAETITVSAIQLFEALPKHPVISMPLVTRILSTSKPTASKAIDLLIKLGILAEIGERKRDRIYKYDKYLQILS